MKTFMMLEYRQIRILFFVFSLIHLTSCSYTQKVKVENFQGTTISIDSIDTYVKTKMGKLKIPGASLAIINKGKVIHYQTYGYANFEKKLKVNKSTIFEGASISKSVFSFFVMKYVEEGKLDLDKPLFEYLEYPAIAYDERYKKITARMVLSHRSGFPNWRENEPDKKLKIKFEPGTNFEYSGEGYQYLAMVLKEIDGGNWTELENEFQRKVAKPLKMEHTSFIPDETMEQKKAEPYDKNNNWIDLKKNYWYKKDKGNFVSASSIHTEPIDFSKWMIAVMKKEQLSKSSYDELFKPHSTINAENGITYFYSLGFASDSTKPENTYYHSGSNDGFTCWYLLNTEKDWGFVVFTNSEYGIELGENLFDYLSE